MSARFGVLGYRDHINQETTHLVCGQTKRTVNLLKGLLRGCWILSRDWLVQSLQEGTWTDEAPFEILEFSPAVALLRQERETFPGVFMSDLFKGDDNSYI